MGEREDSMAQTPYQRKLYLPWQDAHTAKQTVVKVMLKEMIGATENDRYNELGVLWDGLPDSYKAMVGPPPPSRSDDRPVTS